MQATTGYLLLSAMLTLGALGSLYHFRTPLGLYTSCVESVEAAIDAWRSYCRSAHALRRKRQVQRQLKRQFLNASDAICGEAFDGLHLDHWVQPFVVLGKAVFPDRSAFDTATYLAIVEWLGKEFAAAHDRWLVHRRNIAAFEEAQQQPNAAPRAAPVMETHSSGINIDHFDQARLDYFQENRRKIAMAIMVPSRREMIEIATMVHPTVVATKSAWSDLMAGDDTSSWWGLARTWPAFSRKLN